MKERGEEAAVCGKGSASSIYRDTAIESDLI